MKRIFYMFLVVSFIFTACKKEDDDSNNTGNNSSSIIGSWKINWAERTIGDTTLVGTPEEVGVPSNIEFLDNGIFYEDWQGTQNISEWIIIGDSIYLGEDGESLIAKHIISNTDLTLIGRIPDEGTFITVNGTRN